MADKVIEEQIRDTNNYYSENVEADKVRSNSFQLVNGLDNSVTVNVQATYNSDDWSDATQVATESVSASSNSIVTVSDDWDVIRLEVSAGTSPTSGTFTAWEHSN